LSGARFVGQVLQDGFEFELDASMIYCIYRWAALWNTRLAAKLTKLMISYISFNYDNQKTL